MNEPIIPSPAQVAPPPAPAPVVFRPATDVVEDTERVHLRMDLPGVAEQNLEITVENDTLRIRGRQQPDAREGYRPIRTEYGNGEYRRSFTLSRVIDPTAIRAHLRQGVLELELPKRQEALPRSIPVQAG